MEVTAPRRILITPLLVAVNVGVYWAMVSEGVPPMTPYAAQVLPFGANFGPYTVDGEWWRLLSSCFVHYGALHLVMNMIPIALVGALAERKLGSIVFLVSYLLSGVGGMTASMLWRPDVVSAGASGAFFGVAGTVSLFLYLSGIELPETTRRVFLPVVLVFTGATLIISSSFDGIDNAGHVGGLLTGMALGVAAFYRRFFIPACVASLALVASALPIAARRVEDNPRVLITNAYLEFESGNPTAATELAEKAVELAPTDPRALELLSSLQAEQRNYTEAIRVARQAVELDPLSEQAQRVLSRSLFFNRDYDLAVDELRLAIELTPKDMDTRIMLSHALRRLERFDDAVAALDEALKWQPDSSSLYGELGMAHFDRGDLEAAVESLNEAVTLQPDSAEGYNRLSLVLARSGDDDGALEAIQKAVEMRPDAPHILDSLGTVRFYRGEFDQATEAYRSAIELEPDNAVYYYNQSLALRRMGRDVEANRARTEAFRLDPNLDPPTDSHPMI